MQNEYDIVSIFERHETSAGNDVYGTPRTRVANFVVAQFRLYFSLATVSHRALADETRFVGLILAQRSMYFSRGVSRRIRANYGRKSGVTLIRARLIPAV